MDPHPYLAGYPPEITARAARLLAAGELGAAIAERYPDRHDVRSNRALAAFVQDLKARHMKKAPPLQGAVYDEKLRAIENALGLHTTLHHPHGARVRQKRTVRIASLFKDAPPEFLRMVCVHEVAHTKHLDHDRDFYRLCVHMEPDYHQYELDTRLWLIARENEPPPSR